VSQSYTTIDYFNYIYKWKTFLETFLF
jgi:hypothetical protein